MNYPEVEPDSLDRSWPKRGEKKTVLFFAVNPCQFLGHFPSSFLWAGRWKHIYFYLFNQHFHTVYCVAVTILSILGDIFYKWGNFKLPWFLSTLLNLQSGCICSFQKRWLKINIGRSVKVKVPGSSLTWLTDVYNIKRVRTILTKKVDCFGIAIEDGLTLSA